MKILSNSKFKAVSRFIQKHARPLDRALFEYSFGNISPNDVVPPLTAYQNGDGGFGHGLEPDFQTPDSSAIASTIACQYIQKFGLKDHRVIRRSMSYFEKTYDKEIDGWKPVPRIVNKFPHAPWWHIDEKTGKCPIDIPPCTMVAYR